MKTIKLLPILSLILFLVSCGIKEDQKIHVDEKMLSFPKKYYSNIIKIHDSLIAFSFTSLAKRGEEVGYAYENDSEITPFKPEDIGGKCKKFYLYYFVNMLPDGRLGLYKQCQPGDSLSLPTSMYAYNWDTGEIEQLVKGSWGTFERRWFTWNPDMTLGVQEVGGSFPITIAWLTKDGISPMDIEIENRGLTWNLKDALGNPKDVLDGDKRTGTARQPVWSPNGDIIAFFVTTYGILEEPKPKYNINYDLVFVNPDDQIPKIELADVIDPLKVVWSLDGKYLLFDGCYGSLKFVCGLWKYDVKEKSLLLIKGGNFADYIWLDNRNIVAIKNEGMTFEDNFIWKYTLSE